MSICDHTPDCPHCLAGDALPFGKRRKWDALVRAFQTMPIDATASELMARADAILQRSYSLSHRAVIMTSME